MSPPGTLVAQGNVLYIVNDSHTLVNPRYEENCVEQLGELRYEGFREGDPIAVVGRRAEAGVQAEVVFGGTREEYLASLQDESGFALRCGWILAAVGLIMTAPAVIAYGQRRIGATYGRRAFDCVSGES